MISRNGNERTEMPDSEVVPLAQRRRFTAGEKLRILEEAEACTEPGEIGALVRREGIYSSYLSRWRQARDRGQLTALGAQQRGPKPATDAGLVREVATLRRENERLQAKQVRRYKSTTKRNKKHPVAPNLLKRDFSADWPDQKWLSDITYIPTREGWLYLAAILDLYTRRIVGWAMSERMTAALTIDALKMAILQRQPDVGFIHHSDQGSQYTDGTYQTLLQEHDAQPSMNGIGSWYDNAPMESFFGTLKSELVHHHVYDSRDEAKSDLFYYIEGFYNRRQRHSSLDYLSPEAYEHLCHQKHELLLSPCPQN